MKHSFALSVPIVFWARWILRAQTALSGRAWLALLWSGSPLLGCVASQMVVVELTADSKASMSGADFDASHRPGTIHSQFAAWFLWSGKQDFDPDFRPDGWAGAGKDECAVQSDISGEAASGTWPFVFPMEDHRQVQRISRR